MRGGDSNLAFPLCTLFLLAAPAFLVKARGGKGFIEGVFIVVGAVALQLATLVGLVILRWY